MCGFGLVKLDGLLLKGLIEIDLFEGVHELCDSLMFLMLLGSYMILSMLIHNDIILLIYTNKTKSLLISVAFSSQKIHLKISVDQTDTI
jgi:hypothetical protein